MDIDSMRVLFRNPPVDARPAPFWFWNDHIDPDRLVAQYDRLLDGGCGGAVLHARGGLDPAEYLDERWYAGIAAVVKRAAATGTKVWLYDELGWPSGSAGGRVMKKHPETGMVHIAMRDLVVSSADDLAGDREIVAAFRVTRTDPEHGMYVRKTSPKGAGAVVLLPDRIACEPLPLPLDAAKLVGERVLLFQRKYVGGIINYLDARGAAAFIETTHEEYFRRFGEHFGTTITHSFMDEAGFLVGIAELPWRDDFLEIFEKRRGYDLRTVLPAIFFDVPGAEAARFDFWTLATELFREGFAYPMHRWCEDHGIHYSGHYVYETTLKEAIRQLGSTMPLYEYQGFPGIDVLGNDFYSRRFEPEAYGYYLVMVKQAASVVNQLGKPGLMSESYGVGGHHMDIEGMQTATNWQMALGVTSIQQHASFYSWRGERKYDCPPAVDWHEPWWPFARKHMETTARTGWLLNRGRRDTDVLLLHPMASIQASFRHWRTRAERKTENWLFDADLPYETIEKHFTLLSVALTDAQIDYEYGDEELMARHAAVDGTSLRVGRAPYRVVVLPPMTNIRSKTLDLLRAFAEGGGIVLAVGSAPDLVDGRPSEAAREFIDARARRIVDGVDRFDYTRAIAALDTLGARSVKLVTVDGDGVPAMKVHRRIDGDREIVYLANVSRDPVAACATFTTGVTGRIEEWDPSSGATRPVVACAAGREVVLDLAWAPRQARAFVAIPGAIEIPPAPVLVERNRVRSDWVGRRTARNTVLLDLCALPSESNRRLSLWEVQDLLKERIRKSGPQRLDLRFPFFAGANVPPGPYTLAIETVEGFAGSLNGAPLAESDGWFMDPAIRTIPVAALRPGENVLATAARYEKPTDLQIPWLLGDFSLATVDNATFTIEPAPATLGIGPWRAIGLPFYAGTVVYRAEVDLAGLPAGAQAMLDMPGLFGAAEVRVNGAVVDHVLWPPYACDITAHAKPGRNTVEVEVANTLRNLLGAHYDPEEEVHTGAADRFWRAPAGTPKRFLDYGMLSAPEIVVRAAT